MKKITTLFIVFLTFLAVFIGFNACEDENDFDFKNYVPVLKQATGTTAPMQGRHYQYQATTRGGSTYTWTAASTANIVEVEGAENRWKVYINYPDVITAADDPEVISVFETTQGGQASNTLTITVPAVTAFAALPITGSSDVNGGFSSAFSVSPSTLDKIYSTYTWASTKGVVTQSTTEPWKVSIYFSNDDIGAVTVSLTETTTTGFTATSTKNITVNEYCALEDFNDFGGTYSGGDFNEYGIDGYGDFTVTVTSVANRTVTISDAFWFGLWGPGYWDETPSAGNAVELKLNLDGTITFTAQRALQTNDEYDYFIHPRGVARWNACNDQIELYIPYYGDWDDSYGGDFMAYILCTKSLTKGNSEFTTRIIPFEDAKLKPLPIK